MRDRTLKLMTLPVSLLLAYLSSSHFSLLATTLLIHSLSAIISQKEYFLRT
jgi:hypothetical protein